jgi:hypothetical protein
MENSLPLGRQQSFIVIAIELNAHGGGAASEESRRDFAGLLGAGVAHACSLQTAERHDGGWACTALIPDTGQTLALLRRMEDILADFRRRHPDAHARFVVHYGLAFATQPGNKRTYIGSAVRAAHSHLKRLPPAYDRAASGEFSALAKAWSSGSIEFTDLPLPLAELGLFGFNLKRGEQRDRSDPEIAAALRNHLAESLATHIGPFAQILVESAQRSSKSLDDFIVEVAREIDEKAVRARVKDEARAYLKALRAGQRA